MAVARTSAWWTVPVVVVSLAILGQCVPVLEERNSYCKYCRARRTLRSVYLIPVPPRIRENAFSVYWKTVVEPGHKHSWTPVLCGTEISWNTLGHSIGCRIVGNPIYMLPSHLELVVLQSLPDNHARREFVQAFWRYGERPPQQDERRLFRAVKAIGQAYNQNPHRTDWPKVVRDAGLGIDPAKAKAPPRSTPRRPAS